eukprot:COSAG01_NODE_11036_length_2022_cov_44.337493_3_plen_141_part_00
MPDAVAPPRPSRDTAQLPADGISGDSSAEAAELHEHARLLSDVCSSHLGHEDEGSESARLLAAGGSGNRGYDHEDGSGSSGVEVEAAQRRAAPRWRVLGPLLTVFFVASVVDAVCECGRLLHPSWSSDICRHPQIIKRWR